MIILFGSYARGDWKEEKDLPSERKSGHPSDYDILLLTRDETDCPPDAVRNINQAALEGTFSATARVIHHDIGYMNRKLEIGRYFFTDIVTEGRLLYDDGTFTLAEETVVTPAERLEIVQNDFDHWFERAHQFFEHHKLDMEKEWFKVAAFHLHQTAEAAYKAILIVYTNYIPDEHYLALLGGMVAKIDPAPWQLFHSQTAFERDAFAALEYAYIGARYDKSYTIDKPSLLYLAGQVSQLLRLTETLCKERIATLRRVTDQAGQ
jgi:HEPN domain-containing protein/predicted nucleotidyltransferase